MVTKKRIKSYLQYGEKCGIAKQVEGKVVDAYKDDNYGKWHFELNGEKWISEGSVFVE